MKVEPVILDGKFVRLEPLKPEHFASLYDAASEESLWRWTVNKINTEDDLHRYVATAFDEQQRGVSLPFVTIDKASGKVIGSTRFGNIDTKHRHVEIGWTWIHPDFQRTRINTEAKLLMLTHAFETWKCLRIELKTNVLNEKSRNAIQRLGAKQEGIFRKNTINDDGTLRDTVYYSILDDEWPQVKANLEEKLNRN